MKTVCGSAATLVVTVDEVVATSVARVVEAIISKEGEHPLVTAMDRPIRIGASAKQAVGKMLLVFKPGGYEQLLVDWDARSGLEPGPELGALGNRYGAASSAR
jgi:hypothetical protein